MCRALLISQFRLIYGRWLLVRTTWATIYSWPVWILLPCLKDTQVPFTLTITPLLTVPLQQHASDQWYSATAGSGSFHLKIDFKPIRNEPLTIEAFDLLKVIGKGSFGKVMQVRKKDTQRIYALKTIRKAHIAQRPGEITHILAERTVLALVNNPFIVPLKFSFQNPDKLYLVMSFGTI